MGQQLPALWGPTEVVNGDPRGRWIQLLTGKDKRPVFWEGQQPHRACGEPLIANN